MSVALETAYKTVMESLDGTMGRFTEAIITTGKDKVMANFTMPKILVSAEAFGREVCLRDRANMYRVKISVSSVYGVRENW